ncbi:MAG TPA: glycosyltransferase [Bacteroidales bacterium]|nr:glycosyltransferase [Bacteroidales bacterium]
MNIVFTGNYSSEYNRTAIIIEGLKHIPGISIIEYPIQKNNTCDTAKLKTVLNSADVVFLPSFTHNSVQFIRKHTNKPICFDPLISKYLTKVFDYKLVWKYSPRALKNFYKDKRAFSACDFMIADTVAHKSYYARTFKISHERIFVLPVGVNTNDFAPCTTHKHSNNTFTIGFYGGFIPLQGVSNIIDAAHILRQNANVRFELVGNGFEFEAMKKKAATLGLHNITFMGWQPYTDLPAIINSWDICLGIFGNTQKADLVIPNKIYHYAAMQKPIISKHSEAIQELFTHNESILLCSTQPHDIASSITELIENHEKRNTLGIHALQVAQQYNHIQTATQFIRILEQGLQYLQATKHE